MFKYHILNLIIKSDVEIPILKKSNIPTKKFDISVKCFSDNLRIFNFDQKKIFFSKGNIFYEDRYGTKFIISQKSINSPVEVLIHSKNYEIKNIWESFISIPLGYALSVKGFDVAHGSAVSNGKSAACIFGFSGQGKSTLALSLLNKGFKFIGCSSYLSFPRLCDNKSGYCHLDDKIRINGKYIEDYVIGWCHCFKEPDKYIKGNIPKILLSESDFNSDRLIPTNDKLEYDYLTVQPKDGDCRYSWLSYCKNWDLAEKTIKVLSDKLNLKGVVVGRVGCDIDVEKKDLVTILPTKEYSERENGKITLPYHELIEKMNKSKFILMPNLEDASPRVLVEALSLNKPVLVNESILGGWKYVNDKTGEFYNENNIKEQAEKLLKNIENNQYSPREYYTTHYGTVNSGKRFKNFLKKIYPNLSECEYVKFPI